MSRLPVQGGDENAWGSVLNDFLMQAHNNDGSLKPSGVTAAGAITQDDADARYLTPGAADAKYLDQAAGDARYVEGSGVGMPGGVASLDGTGKVPAAQLPAAAGIPDATTTTKGAVRLAGDLAGSADSPTVPGLSAKASTATVISAGTGLTGGGDLTANRSLAVVYGTASGTAAAGNDSRIIGAIQASTATTKGDLLAASGPGAITRLPAGTNGQVLSADSSQTSGLAWTNPAAASLSYPNNSGTATVTPRLAVTDVRDYGAKGDNTTDDAAAINAAIVAAPEGGTVYFPPGIYLVSSTIRLRPYRTYSGGGGLTGRTVIKATTGLTDAVMASEAWYSNQTTCDNPIRIQGLMVNGNNVGTSVRGIVMLNFWSRITDVQVVSTTGHGIELNDTTRNGTNTITNSASENTITACRFDSIGGCGIYQRSGNQQANLDGRIESCFFSTIGQYGIRLGRAAGWYVQNNHLYGIAWDAINTDSCYATVITDNYIEDFGGANQANPGAPTYGYYNGISLNTILDSGRASMVSGNTVTNNQPSSPSAQRFNCLYASAGGSQAKARVIITGNNFGWASTGTPAVSRSWGAELSANTGGLLEVSWGSGQIQRNVNWQRTLVYDPTKVNLIESAGNVQRPFTGWTADPANASGSNSLTLTPGTVYVMEAEVKAGRVSTIDFSLSAGGSGITGGYIGLYDLDRSRLGTSSNVSGAFAASGTKSVNLSTPVAVSDGKYYIAFLVVGSSGPSIQSSADLGIANLGRSIAPYRSATADTGQSSLPASLSSTQTAIGQLPFAVMR